MYQPCPDISIINWQIKNIKKMDRVKWLSVAPRDKTIMWLESVIWHLVTRMEII